MKRLRRHTRLLRRDITAAIKSLPPAWPATPRNIIPMHIEALRRPVGGWIVLVRRGTDKPEWSRVAGDVMQLKAALMAAAAFRQRRS